MARDIELTSGRGPTGIAAAALYVASLIHGEKRTQREVADVAGVTEVTIRNRYKELIKKLKLTKEVEKSKKKICNSDEKAHGVVSMQIVLNQSLNTGASFVADRIGHTEFGQYLQSLELGKKTGIDLPSEAVGQLKSIVNGYDVDYASASFGQGIAVSPIAMIRALSALANGGVLPNPHVVTAIKLQNGITRSIDPGQGPRVLSASSTEAVTNMLVRSYDTALIGGILKQEHYSLAAKTGTAQIAIPGGGGYYTDRTLHSFFGYFPAHDPKFIIFLFAVEPHGQEFSSATFSHPFSNFAKYLINYYSIPPDR